MKTLPNAASIIPLHSIGSKQAMGTEGEHVFDVVTVAVLATPSRAIHLTHFLLFSFVRMKLNVEAIGHLVKDCPKVAITPALKSSICKLKMFLTDEQIAVSLKLKVEDIKSVEC